MVDYLVVKFAHVLTAIVALGSSAGMGIMLEFFGAHPTHGPFILRAIRRIETLLVLPGFVVMLATGLWMVSLAWPLDAPWIQAGIALWGVSVALVGAYLPLLSRQIGEVEARGNATARYRRLSMAGRVLGGAAGLALVVIVYLMVTKPLLAWWPIG